MAIYDAPESLHVGTGTETVFGFNWPYLLPRDLVVTVNGQPVPTVLASPNQVVVTPAPAALSIVRIYRNTPAQYPTYLFATGIPMLPKYIDGNNKQLLYALQEGLLQFAATQATADAALVAALDAQASAAEAAASAAQQARDMRRTVRVPTSDLEIPALPPAGSRANKVLGFDAAGNPIGVLPATGSAMELALDLRNPLDPYKGAGMVGWSRTLLAAAVSNAGQMLSTLPVNIWEFAHLVTNRPVANDPSTWDWAPAFQSIVDSGNPVGLPQGVFSLFTPVYVKQGTVILGLQGQGAGYITGTFIKPTTSAFLSSNFDLQQVFFRLSDVGFIGGTTVMDLGLFHEVDITDCSFFNPTVGGIVLVRGEKHRFERIRMDARSPGIFGFSLGRWEESVHVGYSDAYFGVDGAFFDRASMKDIALQGGAGGYFAYGLKSNILSATDFINFVCHNDKKAGEISAIYVRTRTQMCNFMGIAPDRWGNAASPCPALFDLAFVNSCTFTNVSPSFSGNNAMTVGIRMSRAVNTVFEGCFADGDNVTKYGFVVGNATGQTLTMIACRGAFFHESTSAVVRAQVAMIGCQFNANNAGSSNYNTTDQDMLSTILADTNGGTAATAAWGVQFASGGGSLRKSFYVRRDGPWINGSLSFTNAFGEAGPKLIVNSASGVSPEGVITAPPGSLYLYYSGTAQGKLYVKETGAGNTGWVLK